MSHGIDALMHPVERATSEPSLDRRRSDPALEQLPPCDDPVLPLRQLGKQAVGPSLSLF